MNASAAASVPQHELLSLSERRANRCGEEHAPKKANACKRRRSYSVDVKAQAIRMRLERGMTLQQISDAFGLPASGGKKMVRKWIKDKDKIFGALDEERHAARKVRRHSIWKDVEDRLYEWVVEQKAKGAQLVNATMQEKARELAGDGFRASIGWLVKFKKRYGIDGKQSHIDMSIPLPAEAFVWPDSDAGEDYDDQDDDSEYQGEEEEEDQSEGSAPGEPRYLHEGATYNDFDLSLFDSPPARAPERRAPRLLPPAHLFPALSSSGPLGLQPVVVSRALQVPLSVTGASTSSCPSTHCATAVATAAVTATTTTTTTTPVMPATGAAATPCNPPVVSMTFVSAPVHMSGAAVSMIPASNVTVMIPTPTFRAAETATTTGAPHAAPLQVATTAPPHRQPPPLPAPDRQGQIFQPPFPVFSVPAAALPMSPILATANSAAAWHPTSPAYSGAVPTAATPVHTSDIDPLDRVALEAFLSPTATTTTRATTSPTPAPAAASNGEISGCGIHPIAQL